MNCDRAREALPLDIYGDLNEQERIELQAHREICQACRTEWSRLRATRQALETALDPEAAVDVASIHRQAESLRTRSLRRWKRAALAASAVAAGLILFLLVRPEVRIGGGQLVVRWSDPPAPERREPTVVLVPAPPTDARLEDRVQILSELVQGLRAEMETADRSRSEQIDLLLARLDLMRLQALAHWNETKRDVSALYIAQFGKKE